MSDDSRVQQLLDQLLDSDSSPEEVCESCPELLPIVCERWREVCRLRADLDNLFPLSDEPSLQPPGNLAQKLAGVPLPPHQAAQLRPD